MADVSDLFIERLYRISDQSFKKCGTSIMLINQEGDVLYKIMPISNYTEARFYQLAYQNTLDTSNVYLDIHTEGTIQNYDFDDINFLVKHQLIPKIYGFFYIKHLLINDNEVWGIVSELDYDCSIAIGLENIIYGYEIPAVADIKLGMSHPMNYTYESDVSSDDIPKYIDKWRSIKSQLRNEYFNDPIKANSLIRQITAQMIGLPSQYHHYSTDDIYNLLKKWRQIQASHDTTQASLGLRICSMNYKNCDSEVTDLTPNISKNFTDNECINHISRYIEIGNLWRISNKIKLLSKWISNQHVTFCATSLLIVFDQNNLENFDVRWIDFNYVLPIKHKKSDSCDVNVLKGLQLISNLCVR